MPALAPALNPDYSTALEHFYLPFSRVDAQKREVEAVFFTSPRVRGDKYNLKYETLKRAAKRYMEQPCLREMHQPKAAGKTLRLHFDDATQTGRAILHIVDDAAWEKVEQKVYRGTSIGGVPLICRGDDIEDFDWIELSLVDRPKDPGALFIVARVEDALAGAHTIELPENASDEELQIARGEIEEQLERYDHQQPRDDGGKWTIVAGHRVSVDGHAIDHNDIHAAKKRFGLSDEATGALLAAHQAGKITTDQHLYRTLSHAGAKSSNQGGMLPDVTSTHIESGVKHHGVGGSHEDHWHSEAHSQAPKLQAGMTIGAAIGAHQLQKGDTVHFPAHEGKPAIAGVVHKVNAKTIDIGSSVGGATVGVRAKKDDLKRPGFVKRDGASSPVLHHVEVARGEGIEVFDEGLENDLRGHAAAIREVLARVAEAGTEGGDDAEEALDEVTERLGAILRGEADSALESLERAEGRSTYKTQPRDDIGRWTDGAGKISVSHVHDVMKHEGIHEAHHHEAIKKKIESGELKTRQDVLKHIDAIHATNKKESDKEGNKDEKPGVKTPKKDIQGKEHGKKDDEKTEKKRGQKPKSDHRPGWFHALKTLAKDTAHAFMKGYRGGQDLGRAETSEGDVIPGLVEEFFDGLEDADDTALEAALRSANALLKGEEPVQRVLDSSEVPTRENLEGGAPKGRAALDKLREMFFESDWDGDKDQLRAALHAALEEIVARGEGDESLAATWLISNDVQRMETLQGTVQRLEGELSTVQNSAQATLTRAELAEGEVSRLETENSDLSSENHKLRALPDNSRAVQYGAIPLARSFAANQVLSPATSAHVRRGELEAESIALQTSLITEPDPAKCERGADRLIAVNREIEELKRLA